VPPFPFNKAAPEYIPVNVEARTDTVLFDPGGAGRAPPGDHSDGVNIEVLLAELLKPLADAQNKFHTTLARSFGSLGGSSGGAVLHDDGGGKSPPRDVGHPGVVREIIFKHNYKDDMDDEERWSSLFELCRRSAWPLDLFVNHFVNVTEGAYIGRVGVFLSVIGEAELELGIYPDGVQIRASANDVRMTANPSSTPQWEGMLVERSVLDADRHQEDDARRGRGS